MEYKECISHSLTQSLTVYVAEDRAEEASAKHNTSPGYDYMLYSYQSVGATRKLNYSPVISKKQNKHLVGY